jgi:hypothetical protein
MVEWLQNLGVCYHSLEVVAFLKLDRTRNQFMSYRVPVKKTLREGLNQLSLLFESTYLKVIWHKPVYLFLSFHCVCRVRIWKRNVENLSSGTATQVAFMSEKPSTSRSPEIFSSAYSSASRSYGWDWGRVSSDLDSIH